MSEDLYLVIGGPHGGERHARQNGRHLILYVKKPLPYSWERPPSFYMDKHGPVIETSMQRVQYRLEEFFAPEGVQHYWVPFEQTPEETMKLLTDAYEKSVKS